MDNRRTIVAAACVLLLLGVCAQAAQDWPQWRGANRDGKVAGFAAPAEWPDKLTQKWKVVVGAGDATPALVDERLYVFTRQGEQEVVTCLDAGTGKVIWRDAYDAAQVKGAAARHPGPRSSPAVAAGKVVTLGVGGVLSCLDAAGGKVLWRKDPFPNVVPTFFTASSPLIAEGLAVAHLGGARQGAIIAYDLESGNEKWRWSGEGPEYGSPVLLTADGTTQVVTLAAKSVVGVDLADGKLLWRLPFAPQRRAQNTATPILDGRTVIYTGAARGTKAVRIEKQQDGFVPKELWTNSELACAFNTPVLKDELLFGLSERGNLFCIDAHTGKTAWTDTNSSDRFGAILDVGPSLLALPATGELIVFKSDGARYRELARIKVSETPVYAHPVVSGNRIFVKSRDALALWTVP